MERLYNAVWRRFGILYIWICSHFYDVKFIGNPLFVGRPRFRNAGAITFGKKAIIVSSLSGNPLWGARPCIFHTEHGATIYVGDEFSASNCCLIAKQSIIIGNRVMLGSNVTILDNDMHSVDAGHRGGITDALSVPVVIGDDCWLGANVIILKGVTVGPRSVIGAGVVLRKSVPADSRVVNALPVVRISNI